MALGESVTAGFYLVGEIRESFPGGEGVMLDLRTEEWEEQRKRL